MARSSLNRSQEMEQRPKRAKGRNMGSMVAAFMMIGIISALVLYGIMLGKRNQGPGKATEESVVEKPADPFAGMKYTEEGLATRVYSGSGVASDFESDAEMWQRAREVYEAAQVLIGAATQLRSDDDAAWRDQWADAKGKMEEAMERGDVWRGVLAGQVGETSAEVKRLDRTLQKWRRTLIMLHKTSSR